VATTTVAGALSAQLQPTSRGTAGAAVYGNNYVSSRTLPRTQLDSYATAAADSVSASGYSLRPSAPARLDSVPSGQSTMLGAAASSPFLQTASLRDVSVKGGSSSPSVSGAAGSLGQGASPSLPVNPFAASTPGGANVLQGFVSRQAPIPVDTYSLDSLQHQSQLHLLGGSSLVTMDGGRTQITVLGVHELKDPNSHG